MSACSLPLGCLTLYGSLLYVAYALAWLWPLCDLASCFALCRALCLAICLALWSRQIGLGISETENIGDDPDEMGENLSLANLEGAGHDLRTRLLFLFCNPVRLNSTVQFFCHTRVGSVTNRVGSEKEVFKLSRVGSGR